MADTNTEEVERVKSPKPEVKLEEKEKPAENNSKKTERSDNKSSSSKRRSSAEDKRTGNSGKRSKRDVSSDKAPSTRRIYIANIPYDAKWQDIKDLFRDKIKDCEYVHLFEDDDGKARGCGLVEFKDPNSVKKALELFDKYDYKGRKLVVKEDFDSQRDHTGRIIKDASFGRGRSSNSHGDGRGVDSDSYGGSRHGNQRYNDGPDRNMMNSSDNSSGNKWGNTYGLSPQFLDSLGINSSLTNRVFIANLDYKVSVRKLREIFKMAGHVQNINLNTDKDGNSKGHGLITFEHPVEAVQAVSMFHGQMLHDRPMTVKIDRISENEEAAAFAAKLPKGLKSIGMGLGAGGMPLTNVSAPTGGWGGPGCNEMGMNNAGFSSRGANMGGGFSDRGNISDMRGGNMGGGFSDRGAIGAGGFPDRMTGMGGGTLDRGNVMGNSSDRAGILGNYGDRKGSMDGMHDRSDFGMQNFPDRGMSGNGASAGSFMDRGNALGSASFPDRTFASGGGASNIRSGNNITGAGILGAGASDTARFDDYRRDYPRTVSNYGTSSTTTQEGDYRSYGADEQTLPRYSGPVSTTIIVRNLPVQYSKLDLMDRFLEAGKIEFTKVSGDGLGLVCYATEREAQRAINIFDGSRLDGRVLEVAFR